ncbi:Serine/threonine-protein kinase, active site [Ostreococcus tauri]|uniref:mitogen-activated protein kinase kinase kinase n=1 Tax=Ostreococcus tauri TaxID=70448 RepID=A0A096P7S8_OSTTA|nr:Serine/threonine-protein kinase, active site [Ostreococcus tauri]CEG00082.1 Serine/threonine-protein kinase, active site [Ostreococcus tauri]|eukprot:XP_003082588.2 Serine/threonine-protein kinase, active site [Ostreococcus tauri]
MSCFRPATTVNEDGETSETTCASSFVAMMSRARRAIVGRGGGSAEVARNASAQSASGRDAQTTSAETNASGGGGEGASIDGEISAPRLPGLRLTPAGRVLAAAAAAAASGRDRGPDAEMNDEFGGMRGDPEVEETPLPLPPPLGDIPRAHGGVVGKIKGQILPSSGYVPLEVQTHAEKVRLIQQQERTRRSHSITDAAVTTTAKTAGAAVGAISKMAAKLKESRHFKSASAPLTAVEIADDAPAARESHAEEAGEANARSAHTEPTSNPFVQDESRRPGRNSSELSDSGVPSSPHHRRASSAGNWSDMSYTTSDDGMLRMCHTSLAPTKPRRWTKGDNLGEGSFGSVWLALNGDTGELFALKEVRFGSSDKHREESIEQLEQEVDVLSRLVHPNIVRYIGVTREEAALYIFLEYVPGGSIASLVHRFGKFEENVIRVYTRQLLIGLSYLHSQRVLHRDIKGANILVEKSGRIKLADFGMAKVLENVSHGKSFKGSACWMAPEVIRQKNVGFEADIWSVGCTVYEMATGAPPWSDCSTQVQIIFKIASSEEIPVIPEHLSPDGQDFLRLCLQRDATRRPEAVALLDEPFVVDAHRSSNATNIPGLQYDTWASSSVLSFRDDEASVRSGDGTVGGMRSNQSSMRHVAWGDLE